MVNYKIKNKKLFHDLQTDKLVCIVNIKLLYVFLYVYKIKTAASYWLTAISLGALAERTRSKLSGK